MHARLNQPFIPYWMLLCLGCNSSLKAESTTTQMDDSKFQIHTVDLSIESIEIVPSPHEIEKLLLSSHAKQWTMVMNAGMFEPDHTPVGLQIIDEHETTPLNLRNGQGNFYLKPNGVFVITNTSNAMVLDSLDVPSNRDSWSFATQSGPLLLKNRILHPALNPKSKHKHIRNAVCIQDSTHVVFILSTVPVQFYELAIYMKQNLHCTDGLYLDGAVSVLYTRSTGGTWSPPPMPTTLGSWLIVQQKSAHQ